MKQPHMRLLVAIVITVISAGLLAWSVRWQESLDPPPDQVEALSAAPVPVAVPRPTYKPPRRGTPHNVMSGGTRSVDTDRPLLVVLAPQHVGWTIHEQPTVYWYVSQPIVRPLVVRVIGGPSSTLLLETTVPPPIPAGIHAFPLARYGVRLAMGDIYHVGFELSEDPAHKSLSLWAEGVIERVPRTTELTARLDRSASADLPALYADEGLWYDAMDSLSEMIRTMPENLLFQEYRRSLLEQVSLDEVARRVR